jgi:hypothetical protein
MATSTEKGLIKKSDHCDQCHGQFGTLSERNDQKTAPVSLGSLSLTAQFR